MTADELHTEAIKALRILTRPIDAEAKEEYMRSLLVYVYQAGRIDANDEQIKRNTAALTR